MKDGDRIQELAPVWAVDALAKLREPFDASDIDKLPKIPRKITQDDSIKPSKCRECHGFHKQGPGVVHLDYVGHAALTARLLDVDLHWDWEPLAQEDNGFPLLERNERGDPIGLWIRLRVAGVTRIGYGSCDPGKSDAVKELIGDALRNAAMRFGCALSLWQKEGTRTKAEQSTQTTDTGEASSAAPQISLRGNVGAEQGNAATPSPPAPSRHKSVKERQLGEIHALAAQLDMDHESVRQLAVVQGLLAEDGSMANLSSMDRAKLLAVLTEMQQEAASA